MLPADLGSEHVLLLPGLDTQEAGLLASSLLKPALRLGSDELAPRLQAAKEVEMPV